MMSSDGRERPTLSASLMKKLNECRDRFELSEDSTSSTVIHRLADQFVGSFGSAEPLVKKARGSAMDGERDFSTLHLHSWDGT